MSFASIQFVSGFLPVGKIMQHTEADMVDMVVNLPSQMCILYIYIFYTFIFYSLKYSFCRLVVGKSGER